MGDCDHTVSRKRCIQLLTLYFLAYKSCLLFLALLSPGPGYDTSTSLLESPPPMQSLFVDPSSDFKNRVLKLVRWDAIYYTSLAARGHVFEQEWAFGIGLSGVISRLRAGS